jgi:hypothetical protein
MNRQGRPRTGGLRKAARMKYFVVVLAVAIGITGVVAGGADNSPGLQLLSVLLIIGAVVLGVRMVRRSR